MNLTAATHLAMQQHAFAEYPHEACGLIVVVKGKQRYLPCRNTAQNSGDNFQMHPEDFAKAEDLGSIVGLFHSHPDCTAALSQGDLVACEQSALPWFVLSVNAEGVSGDMVRNDPTGYVAPLIGREFVHGVLDCYALIKDYYSRELGIELPEFEREDEWWLKGQDLYLQQFATAGFAPITNAIQPGDCILMQIRAPTANHAAVYIGDGLMLHHMYGRLSTKDVYDGYFQETTRLIVRHKDM